MPHVSPFFTAGLQVVAAYAIFFGSYIVFAFGKFPGMKIDRPGAAVIGAVLVVVSRVLSPWEGLRAIDVSTLLRRFAVMLIFSSLRLAGIFDCIPQLVV